MFRNLSISLSLFAIAGSALADGKASDSVQGMAGVLPILLVVAAFYFIALRPQNKKMKEHAAAVNSLKQGDKVIISGGIKAKVISPLKESFLVEIAHGVKINVLKSGITSIEPKPINNAQQNKEPKPVNNFQQNKDSKPVNNPQQIKEVKQKEETADNSSAMQRSPSNSGGAKRKKPQRKVQNKAKVSEEKSTE